MALETQAGTPDRLRRRQREESSRVNLRQLVALEDACFAKVGSQVDLSDQDGHHTNPIWREKVVKWCYDVVDHLNESRSIVYSAMNILDRYVTKENLCTLSDKTFELASLSALFLAVRISGTKTLLLSQLLGMSRSGLSAKDIIKMGTSMIKALSWDHRVVTPMEFVRAFCSELPPRVNNDERQNILNKASYLVEISVCDVDLSGKRGSHVALAAMLNALNSNRSLDLPSFNQSVEAITEVFPESTEVAKTRIRLQKLLNSSSENNQVSSPVLIVDDDNTTIVSAGSLPILASEGSDQSSGCNKRKEEDDTVNDIHSPKRRKTEFSVV